MQFIVFLLIVILYTEVNISQYPEKDLLQEVRMNALTALLKLTDSMFRQELVNILTHESL